MWVSITFFIKYSLYGQAENTENPSFQLFLMSMKLKFIIVFLNRSSKSYQSVVLDARGKKNRTQSFYGSCFTILENKVFLGAETFNLSAIS